MTVIRTSDLENVNNPSVTSSLLTSVANTFFSLYKLGYMSSSVLILRQRPELPHD